MNRPAITLVVLLVLITVLGAFLFLRSSSPSVPGSGDSPPVTFPSDSSSSQTNQSKEAVQAAFRTEIAPYNNDNVQLYETVVAENYAIQAWRGNNTGGEALLKYNDTEHRWIVITGGGGAWSVDGLIEAGVPRIIAEVLLKGVRR